MLAVVVHVGHGLVEALVKAVKIVLVLREAVHIADGHDVLAPPLQRIHAEHLADVLNVAFVRPRGLRHAVAAHGAADGFVGKDGVGIALEILAGIELREGAHGLGHDAVAVGGVSTLIGEQLDLACGEAAVRMQPGDQMDADGVAHAVGDKGVLARNVDLHEAAAELHGKPCGQRFIQRILLVAEAAADVGLDDADAAPGNVQRLSDGAAHDVRDLRRGNDDDLACFLIGVDDVIFNMAVLHGGGVVPLVHADEPRLLDGFGIVADADVAVMQNIMRKFLMKLRLAVLHGLLHVQNEGKLLVFHADLARGLRCGDLILRDHGRDIVAVIAHMAVQQAAVSDVLMRRLHRPRVTGGRELDVRHVEAGEDAHDARHLLCLGNIHGLDIAVGNGGADDSRDQCASVAQVVCVLCAACRFVESVNARDAFSNFHRA